MPAEPHPTLQQRLEAYLGAKLGKRVSVANLERLPGGVSRETWGFDLLQPDGPAGEPLVLRMDTDMAFVGGSRQTEFRLLEWVAARGIPVPTVLWCETDPGILGAAFLIMRRVAGEWRVNRLQDDPRFAAAARNIVGQLAGALAAIHALRPEDAAGEVPGLPVLPVLPIAEAIREQDALYRHWAVDPHPVLELALQWLTAHRPPERPLVLVHGDFRIGNVIFDESGLRAILDWELAHFGDPLEDVAWVFLRSWRGGREALELGGVGEREAFLQAYEHATGSPIDRGEMRFWDVFAHTTWAIVTLAEVGGFLGGLDHIELASMGRRTAEIEWDLLHLLEDG
jgi:aminoglycoside phosphotransferase (APT) family kinase protein